MPFYKNPDLRKSLTPTLDQLKKYLEKATSDNVKIRDVRPLMSFLQRLAQIDRYFLGLIQTRKIAVLGFPYTIKYPENIAVPESEKKKLQQIKSRFVKSQMHKSFNTLMNGILFGQSAARLQWQNIKPYGDMVVEKKNLQLTELDYSLENDLALEVITTDENNRITGRDPIDVDTHLFCRYNPIEGIENDFPGSIARANMIYIWLKYTEFFNWSKSNEKWGDPLVVAQYDKERASPDDLTKIEGGLKDLGGSGKAMFSKDIELKFLEAMRSGISDMHDKFISSVNQEMAISVLGQTLTSDIKDKGSFAAAKVHNFVRQDILWGDIIEFQNILSSQYVMKDYTLNYGEPRDAFPIFEFATDEIQDFESNARTFSELKSANPDMNFKKEEVYQRTGWSVPAEDDEII